MLRLQFLQAQERNLSLFRHSPYRYWGQEHVTLTELLHRPSLLGLHANLERLPRKTSKIPPSYYFDLFLGVEFQKSFDFFALLEPNDQVKRSFLILFNRNNSEDTGSCK